MPFIRAVFATTALTAMLSIAAGSAHAGAYIFSGTDADDHGSATATANVQGWLYMQRAIENLGAAVTNGNKVVVSLGSNVGTTAGNAAASAFNKSSLAAAGWTYVVVDSAASITAFFNGTGSTTASSAGVIMLDSGSVNVTGGLASDEDSVLTSNAGKINSFLGTGGALFSQANTNGFLSTLVPGLSIVASSQTGINLTAAGSAAFPGLSNSDLSAGPYHVKFTNVGSIPVLGVGTGSYASDSIIIGASAGSITAPVTSVSEPASMLPLMAGLAAVGLARQRVARSGKQNATGSSLLDGQAMPT